MAEYVLKTKNLCKTYKHFKALDDLNMNVPRGAIYGFVGRNGAGKTTLIRMICGLQYPTNGDFELFGVRGTDKNIGTSRRRIGAIVETPSLFADMTAEENIRYQFNVIGLTDFSKIKDLLELVGLEDTGKKKIKNFSLGMRQRLGIAVALSGNPDFLILDEPINGLDPQGIIEMRELILKLNHEKNITFLISSHILDELSKLATHYGFIDKGTIVKELSAEELYESCRKCVTMHVSDNVALVRVLDKKGIEYKIIDDNTVNVYDKPNITNLVHELDKEKCELISVSEHDESLEGFYLSLVGGESHE
ncbi:MAG: ATP-binding cassette domain-containing protein [Lachnospiraceae bacterium]|nr:ATP-binding cassette domain-containing protein [Lachnospiraceae bacterium]MBR6476436.1 ATP-binding cassette domain-containing protein [Lachnospiraceae bacterium]